jgi:hypothetical protein
MGLFATGTYSGLSMVHVEYVPQALADPSGKIIHGCNTPSITITAACDAVIALANPNVLVLDATVRV